MVSKTGVQKTLQNIYKSIKHFIIMLVTKYIKFIFFLLDHSVEIFLLIVSALIIYAIIMSIYKAIKKDDKSGN